MSIVLALDTSTEVTAVGLGRWPSDPVDAPEVIGELNLDTPRAALTHLVPTILRLLEACEMDIKRVDAVLVGRGPGSFTGVRIGVSTAKGIASGLRVPLWGAGTLDAVAERFAGRDGLLGVVGDAMRREVYPALFRCEAGHVERLTPDAVAAPSDVAAGWAELGDQPIMLAGNGLARYEDVFRGALGDAADFAEPTLWTPTGSGLLEAGWRARAWQGEGAPGETLPVYTRLSDAEEAEQARGGRVPPAGVAGPGEDAS